MTKFESWALGPKVEHADRWTVSGLTEALGALVASAPADAS